MFDDVAMIGHGSESKGSACHKWEKMRSEPCALEIFPMHWSTQCAFHQKLECWWFKVTWHSVCVLADNPVCFISKYLECRWLKIQVTAPRKCLSIVCHLDFTEGYHCSWRMCYWKPHYSPQLIVNKRVFWGLNPRHKVDTLFANIWWS